MKVSRHFKYFLKINRVHNATIKAPKGIKTKECVNCLWNSSRNNGSELDLINISKSGARPAKHPSIAPAIYFLLPETVCAKIAPKAP